MTKAHLSALALLAAACAGDLPPRSLLQDVRVLALLAKPLEAGPDETVTVRGVTFAPDGATITETWSFCPFTLGPTANDACAVEACVTVLVPAADGSVSADPGALALQCLQKYGGSGPAGAALPSQVPDRLEVLFRCVASAPGFEAREAVLRVPFYPRGAPPDRNAPPKVTSLAFGGQAVSLVSPPDGPAAVSPAVPKGGQVEVHVTLDPSSAQRYQDSSGRTVDEQLFVSFYTTAGRFDFDRGAGQDESVQLKDEKVPAGVTSANVYAVAHDDRGGATVLGPYTVSFAR